MNWSTTQFRRLRRWRVLGGLGGLLLFSAFFMPAVKGCNSPVVLADYALKCVEEALGDGRTASDLLELLSIFTSVVAAYLFGLLVLIICLRGWRFHHASEKNLGISVAVLAGALIIPFGAYFVWALYVHGFPGWGAGFVFAAALAIVSPLYFLCSIRMGAAGLLCLRWYVALCGLAWFGMWLLDKGFDGTYYGLWLSMLALILILVSTHGEVRLRTRRTGLQTCWGLLRCRLQLHDLDGPRCFGCGYLLIGLPTNRCPECGREFDPAEHGLDAENPVLHSTTSEDR